MELHCCCNSIYS